ncbi:unnamed protein product [Urochloa humidicola]
MRRRSPSSLVNSSRHFFSTGQLDSLCTGSNRSSLISLGLIWTRKVGRYCVQEQVDGTIIVALLDFLISVTSTMV